MRAGHLVHPPAWLGNKECGNREDADSDAMDLEGDSAPPLALRVFVRGAVHGPKRTHEVF
jgi:hypothetical protein